MMEGRLEDRLQLPGGQEQDLLSLLGKCDGTPRGQAEMAMTPDNIDWCDCPDSFSPCTSQETCGTLTQRDNSREMLDGHISAEGDQQSLEQTGRSFFHGVANRYVKSVIVLDDLRAQLESEIMEFLMREYHQFPSALLIGNLFLNEDFTQDLFSSIFSSMIDSLSICLSDLFDAKPDFSLTLKQIERLSTQKLITRHFGSLLATYRSSPKLEEDAIAFLDDYYRGSPCDRCKRDSCATCQRLFAFSVSRRIAARDRAKEIYRVVAVELYLKTYLLFLSQTLDGLDTFSSLHALLTATRSGNGEFSQLDFMELFLLGKFSLQGALSPQIKPSAEHQRGSLRAYLQEAQLFDVAFFPPPLALPVSEAERSAEASPPRAPAPAAAALSVGDGHFTRSRAPFLPTPPPHHYDPSALEQLSEEDKNLVSLIRSKTDLCQNLERLVEDYRKTMSDLPGGVHSSTTQTVVAMVEKLRMSSTESCWIDIGSGPPLMALQGSLFNKFTLALDLPPVMRSVFQILQLMPPEQRILANNIFLIEGDILHLDTNSIPPEMAASVTHITNFIGTDEANDATVRFALSNFSASLRFLCVRGRYSEHLERILEGYGFLLDPTCSFMMSLKASTTHRRKRVSTYVKQAPPSSPLPDLSLIAPPRQRVTLIAGLYRTSALPGPADRRDRENYLRALVADYCFDKVLCLSFQQLGRRRGTRTAFHPHSLFLPSELCETLPEPPMLRTLRSFAIELLETDLLSPDCCSSCLSLLLLLAPSFATGGRAVFLKSEAAVTRTLSSADQLSLSFQISVSAISSASPFYAALLQSESALREMVEGYVSLAELVRRNGDGSGDAIVLQRSDDPLTNERSWKSFREMHAPVPASSTSREARGKRRPCLSSGSSSGSGCESESPELGAGSPATSVDSHSEQSDSSSPTKPQSRGRGRVKGRGRGGAKRRRVLQREQAEAPEIIDLTGDSLEHARNFKRSLHKKGRVTVTLVGEDNIPFTCVIPSSDSEPEEPEPDEPQSEEGAESAAATTVSALSLLPPIFYNSEDEI